MTNALQEVQRLGQSIWYDNIRRGLIKSGELASLIELGVSGVTSNPTIFEKAIAGSTDYDETLLKLAKSNKSTQELFEAFAIEDIRAAADLLRPIYDRTGGDDGYASLEVGPTLAHDTEGTIAEALRLFAALDRPNVMVKVPATPEGIPAIRSLIGRGINVNVTLIFSRDAYHQAADAYISGLEALAGSGGDVSRVASVASFFVSRLDSSVDALLEESIRSGRKDLEGLLGRAAIANAKLAYRDFKAIFGNATFTALKEKGARPQRPLWASTGTKNPAYSDVLYLDSLIGANTINTVPPATLTAFLDHGCAASTLEQEVEEAQQAIQDLTSVGIDLDQVTDKLLSDGLKGFVDSFEKLMVNIEDKKARLLAGDHDHPGVSLGDYLPDVESALADLHRRQAISRIWGGDHTVWKPDPTEITNRLGWLTVTDAMCEQAPVMEAFAKEVLDAGFRHVVVLGMGGSSLGPEVLRQAFGSAPGYPELIVLDSTIPAWVQSVTEAVDPARTLFIVSSKSGSTTEPNMFYGYFRDSVEKSVGKDWAGQHFIAITDPGTSLDKMANEQGFLRVFLNPSNIGGRYSVLSYFGLVPAVLMGLDVLKLLDRADCMREGTASCVPVHENPGAFLGVVMGVLAKQGRDKLTLVTSPSISSFGLWVEQLIAESTGKEGQGIVPVAGEPLGFYGESPNHSGDDRLFVYLRLDGDDNNESDEAIQVIESSGQPVVRLDIRDTYDLGGEFFRWELATVVAGSILGINPFDQPNVQAAKDMTESVLGQFESSGKLPAPSTGSGQDSASLKTLLDESNPADYLAIMAYVLQTPEVDQALEALRRKVTEKHGLATTMGYGPRFLHSTGQLHKGGPGSGLFLQLTAEHTLDLPIPSSPYNFGVLADAQAVGDLQALLASERRTVRVQLGSNPVAGIKRIADELA